MEKIAWDAHGKNCCMARFVQTTPSQPQVEEPDGASFDLSCLLRVSRRRRDEPGEPWMLLLDVATSHIQVDTRRQIMNQTPHIVLIYIPGRTKSFDQPLGRAVMNCLKACVANRENKHDGESISKVNKEVSEPDFDISLPNAKCPLPKWFPMPFESCHAKPFLWSNARTHLRSHDDDLPKLLASAEKHHAEGTLCRNFRTDSKVNENATFEGSGAR